MTSYKVLLGKNALLNFNPHHTMVAPDEETEAFRN